MATSQTERLNIEVHESGSSNVVEMFNKIAAEARAAVDAIRKLRKEVGGKGTVSEAKKGGKGSSLAAAKRDTDTRIAEVKRLGDAQEAAERRKIKIQRASLTLHDRITARGIAEAKRLENAKEAAERRQIQIQRASLTLDERVTKKRIQNEAKVARARERAAESARKHNVGIRNRSIANELKREAAAHRSAASAAKRHSAAMNTLARATSNQTVGLRSLGNQVFFVQRAFAALGGVLLLRGFVSMSDQYQNMQNRIRLVTDSTEELNSVQKRLQDIARDTRQSLGATVETYVRLRKATERSGISSERLFGVLTTLNQMLTVSGATAIETEQSIRQLSQAFSKGKLDGDEFRSVSEAMPAILTALEVSLGKTRGELRDMSEAGQLTTQVLVEAFESTKQKAADDFGKSITTIGQAWVLLKNAVLEAVGEFNEASGAIGLLVDLTVLLSKNLWVIKLLLQGIAAYAFVSLIRGMRTFTTYLITKAIPAVLAYGTAVRSASTADFIGPLTRGGNISKLTRGLGGLTEKSGMIGTMARYVGQLGKALGRLAPPVAVVGTGIAAWKLGKAADDAGGLSDKISDLALDYGELIGVFGGAGAPASGDLFEILEKHRNKLVELEAQKAKKISTGGDVQEIKALNKKIAATEIQITLNERIAEQRRAAEAAALEEEVNASAVKEVTASYEALKKELVAAEPNRAKYTKDMETVKQAHELGIIKVSEMERQLGMLARAFDAAGQSATGKFLTNFGEQTDQLENATNKYNEVLNKTGNRKQAAQEAKDELDLRQRTLRIQRELIKAKAKFTSIDVAEDFAIKEIQLEKQKAEFEKLVEEKRGRKLKDTGLRALLESLNPILAAQNKLDDGWEILEKSIRRGLISNKEAAEVYDRLRGTLEDLLEPTKALNKETEKIMTTFGMTSDEMQEHAAIMDMQTKLLAANNGVWGDAESQALANWIAVTKAKEADQKYNDAVKSVTDSIQSRTQAMDEYKIALEGIEGHKSLSDDEKKLSILSAQQKLYPDIADSLADMRSGTAQLTDEERQSLAITEARNTTLRELNLAFDEGAISLREYTIMSENARAKAELLNWELKNSHSAFREIKTLFTDTALEELWISTMASGFQALEDSVVSSVLSIEEALFDMATNSEVTLGSFADGMKDAFSSMADAMLEDLTRLLIRMALVAALNATLGGGLPGKPANFSTGAMPNYFGARHGGTFRSEGLPRFAHGGSMQVGGQGGPDTKLVQFMASPGENVHVTNPGQSRLDNRPQEPAPAPVVNVNTVFDPSEVPSAMASASGERVILNVLQKNSSLLARMLK